METKIPKGIRDYQESIAFGLFLRQLSNPVGHGQLTGWLLQFKAVDPVQ